MPARFRESLGPVLQQTWYKYTIKIYNHTTNIKQIRRLLDYETLTSFSTLLGDTVTSEWLLYVQHKVYVKHIKKNNYK